MQTKTVISAETKEKNINRLSYDSTIRRPTCDQPNSKAILKAKSLFRLTQTNEGRETEKVCGTIEVGLREIVTCPTRSNGSCITVQYYRTLFFFLPYFLATSVRFAQFLRAKRIMLRKILNWSLNTYRY